MKIKFTHPDKENDFKAGLTYDVPDIEAMNYIENDWAVLVIEKLKKKTPKKSGQAVKDGNR